MKRKIRTAFLVWMLCLTFVLASCGTAKSPTPENSASGSERNPNESGTSAGTPGTDPGETEETGTYYTVTFDGNGGSETESLRILAGNPVRRPETPEREGFFLSGWYRDPETTQEWNFDTDRVNANITLYAGWTAREEVAPTPSLTYVREGNAYTVTGVGEETVIIIPAVYNGLPVTRIQGHDGTGAFARKAIVSVTVPDSIVEIGQNSFHNCSELTAVNISETSALTTIGNNAFSGNHSLQSLWLPAGVASIGDSAFNNCGAIDFTVSADNAVYRSENGHLIERSSNTLIRGGQSGVVPEGIAAIAPAAFRRAGGITELVIPASVVRIGNYIIADSSIQSIRYAGTQSAWEAAIAQSKNWNYGNRDVPVITEG